MCASLVVFVACAPESPSAPAEAAPAAPTVEAARRQVDYRVTTVPHVPQQRFLIELVSLSDRELCFSADRWPTAEGLMGQSRAHRVEGEMHRLAPGATRNGFLRFDQFNPVAIEGHSARYIDIDPEPVFCESGAPL